MQKAQFCVLIIGLLVGLSAMAGPFYVKELHAKFDSVKDCESAAKSANTNPAICQVAHDVNL